MASSTLIQMLYLIAIITLSHISLTQQQQQDFDCLFVGCRCSNSVDINKTQLNVECKGAGGKGFPPKLTNASNLSKPIASLSMSDYDFQELPAQAFAGLIIESLLFRNNKLEKIRNDSFNGIVGLASLTFHSEPLILLEANSLRVIKDTTTSLTITNCNVTDVTMSAIIEELRPLNKLRSLNMASNRLNTISRNWLTNFTELVNINFAKNNISNISTRMFDTNEKLKWVDLSYNKMRVLYMIAMSLLKSIKKLEYLDLSFNSLGVWDNIIAIDNFESLQTLNLSGNGLASLPNKELRAELASFRTLNLSNNLLSGGAMEDANWNLLNQLKVIDLSSNQFNATPNLKELKTLSSFHFNNQSGKLTELKNSAFAKMSDGVQEMTVNLAQNNIRTIGNMSLCPLSPRDPFISYLKIDVTTLALIHKCVLKQLAVRNRSTQVVIDVNDSNNTPNMMLYRTVCNCNLVKFLQMFNIRLAGVCQGLNNVTCSNVTQSDDCLEKKEFECPIMITSTTTSSTKGSMTTTTTKVPNSSVRIHLSLSFISQIILFSISYFIFCLF